MPATLYEAAGGNITHLQGFQVEQQILCLEFGVAHAHMDIALFVSSIFHLASLEVLHCLPIARDTSNYRQQGFTLFVQLHQALIFAQ